MYKKKVFYILTVAITAGFITLAVTLFNCSYMRVGESISDLCSSFKYYFCEIFAIEHGKVATVLNYSDVLELNIRLPKLSERFFDKLTAWFYLLFNKSNFTSYTDKLGGVAVAIMAVITIGLPIVLALYFLIKKTYLKENTKHGRDTIPLKAFKAVSSVIYEPVKKFVTEYFSFLKERNKVLKLWTVIWLFNLNIVTIIIEFVAYYLYFAVTLDLVNLYTQIYKLIVDLQVVIRFVPLPIPL